MSSGNGSSSSAVVSDIFASAGQAFGRLAELTRQLHADEQQAASGGGGGGGKWSAAELDMLRDAVSRFGADLNRVTELVKARTLRHMRGQVRQPSVDATSASAAAAAAAADDTPPPAKIARKSPKVAQAVAPPTLATPTAASGVAGRGGRGRGRGRGSGRGGRGGGRGVGRGRGGRGRGRGRGASSASSAAVAAAAAAANCERAGDQLDDDDDDEDDEERQLYTGEDDDDDGDDPLAGGFYGNGSDDDDEDDDDDDEEDDDEDDVDGADGLGFGGVSNLGRVIGNAANLVDEDDEEELVGGY